jgi:methionine-rich copper-binding protein CopC
LRLNLVDLQSNQYLSHGGILVKKIIAFLGSALLVFALASAVYVPAALAHAQIISCTPEIGSTVAQAPATVTCKTSEAMDPKASSLGVVDAMGMQVDKGDSKVDLNDPDRVTITVSLDAAMIKDGLYTVKWKTLSAADGDAAEGEFQFAVGAQPVKIGPTATPAPEGTQAAPLPDGTIKIVSPADKTTIPAGKTDVKIALVGVELGDQYHWHVYLDSNMVTMIVNKSDSATIDVPAGEHDIKVTLADASHTDLASAQVHVTAQGTGSGAQATDAPTMAMAMGTDTPTSAPTMAMVMETPTAVAAQPTAAPQPTATTTLPTTGGDVNVSLYGLVMLFGVLLLGVGAIVAIRARR